MFKRKTKVLLFMVTLLAFTLVSAGISNSDAASKAAQKARTAGATQVVTKPFSKDSDCAACHPTYVDSMKNNKMLLSKHSAMTTDCFSCHKEAALVAAHAKVTKAPGKLFRQRKYPNDQCVMCHGDYAKLVEKTKDSTVLKTTAGKIINPHDTHVGKVECYNCHKMHKDKPPIEYCYGCHHPRQLNNCKDCHAPKKD